MKEAPLIVLEGIVGCGKTTQAKVIETELKNRKLEYFLGREPGSNPTAEKIRSLVLSDGNLSPLTELLLFEAARSEYVSKDLQPRISKGIICITDRFYHSTIAFQGYGRNHDIKKIKRYNKDAVQGLWPSLTFIFDVDNLKSAVKRAKKSSTEAKEEDKFESLHLDFHKKVRDGYREMKSWKNTILVPHYEEELNIEKRISMISNYVLSHLNPFLDKHYPNQS